MLQLRCGCSLASGDSLAAAALKPCEPSSIGASAMRLLAALLLACSYSSALVVQRPSLTLRRAPRIAVSRAVVVAQADKFDVSAQQFDLLSLRSFRRDTILQYDATNQSEPLRIALTLLGILFSLSLPALAADFRIDELTANVGALVGTGISGGFFARNRGARLARMLKIEREYAMGDLRATYRGRQTSSLRGATRPALRDTATPHALPPCSDMRGSLCSVQSSAVSGAWWWWRAARQLSTQPSLQPSSTAAG